MVLAGPLHKPSLLGTLVSPHPGRPPSYRSGLGPQVTSAEGCSPTTEFSLHGQPPPQACGLCRLTLLLLRVESFLIQSCSFICLFKLSAVGAPTDYQKILLSEQKYVYWKSCHQGESGLDRGSGVSDNGNLRGRVCGGLGPRWMALRQALLGTELVDTVQSL